ncbi:uncharacterized protein LOC127283889 [Leptopilina boulardi]|uniref:uncharacterized protein LOC127283889 n=1 Tax=Leptopilina boulardi TaxID=63433 RepID=UPI0021F6510F|nr:uncharacterized protein LOC127283889 [Leptopilina boulardi]
MTVNGSYSRATILIDTDFASNLFTNYMDVYVHISTKAIPSSPFCKELISFLLVKDGYAIPSAWAITNDVSREGYRNIFQKLRDIIPGFTINTAITTYSHDFEAAIREVFPGANVYGSLLHYSQRKLPVCKSNRTQIT